MKGTVLSEREIWRLTGKDVLPFLQGIVSNDVLPLGKTPGIVWTALLTPQGKYLADFFVVRPPGFAAESVLVDLPSALATTTMRRVQMYRLRTAVEMVPAALHAVRGLGTCPDDGLTDPRHPALGWRAYRDRIESATVDWDAIRVENMIPEYPSDLVPDESYLLEMGFDRLHGLDFRKGCYVGQEVTARMKHKTELKKGLVRLRIEGSAAPGTPITLPDGREAGRLGTVAGGFALAHLRFDRLEGPLQAGEARLFSA